MKKHLFFLAIVAFLLNACGPVYVVHQDPPPTAAPPPADPEDVSYQNFYDQLSPYGQWIDDPQYGYVWMPDAGPDFKPYATNGHWVYTDEGWTWDSGYPWGWAAFHYGRWFFQNGYGWMWIPGQEWAPAWVSWRNSSDYYGWAPLGPGISAGVSFGGGYNPPYQYWNFVPHQYIASPQIHNYYVNETRNVTIINNTTVIINTSNNNTRIRNNNYAGGPDPNEVGRFSGAAVRPMVIRNGRTPGEQNNNGALTIYRPRVNGGAPNNTGNGGRPAYAPARVQPLNNVRPVNTNSYSGDRNGDRNNPGSSPVISRPGAQPVTPTVNQGYNRPFNQPANPPAGQPSNQFTRPGSPQGSSVQQQPASSVQQPAAQSLPPAGQPSNQFTRPGGQPSFQQPASSAQQQPAGANSFTRPGGQPAVQGSPNANGQPGNPAFNRPSGRTIPPQMQAGQSSSSIQPANQPTNPNRSAVRPNPSTVKPGADPNAPKHAPKPAKPKDDKKKDDTHADTRP